MAAVIPFPLDRISAPSTPSASPVAGAESSPPAPTPLAVPVPLPLPLPLPVSVSLSVPEPHGAEMATADLDPHPVGVEDLRERIRGIEAQAVASEAPPAEVSPREATRAKNIALHSLSTRGRSEAEVRERLVAREVSPDVIEEEMGRLIAVGLIDDRALAATLVDTLRGRKKLGDSVISQTLRRRKIPAEIIADALAEGEGESGVAVFELARDRARSMGHLDPDVAFRRIVGFVQRRGYSGPQVFEAARRALADADNRS